MKVSVLIVTYGWPTLRMSGAVVSDADWLRFSLASIAKNLSGQHEVVVVAPRRDKSWIEPVAKRHQVRMGWFDEAPGKGMLDHMVQVCSADQWCPDADVILHTDADVVFKRRLSVDYWLKNGKPIILWSDPAEMLASGNETRVNSVTYWDPCVRACLGRPMERYAMCAMPILHVKDIYAPFRAEVEKVTGRPFREYVLSCRNEFPQTFAEFPALGQFAWDRFRDRYEWLEAKNSKAVMEATRHFWSHAGVNDRVRQELAEILAA